jgi:oligoendopeptidase F
MQMYVYDENNQLLDDYSKESTYSQSVDDLIECVGKMSSKYIVFLLGIDMNIGEKCVLLKALKHYEP